MKRMHIHISVDNLDRSIGFYSQLFGAQPSVHKPDYAKWMLDDPRVNFAISQRGEKPGLNHLGIQAENDEELSEIKTRLDTADMAVLTETGTTCCYAKSDKHWVQDPSGIPWETYRTLDSAPTFNATESESPCCVPPTQAIAFSPRKKTSCG